MKRVFGYLLLVGISFALVWVLVLPRWSAQNRPIGEFEFWAYLVALPIGIVALGLFATRLWRRRRERANAQPEATSDAPPVAGAQPAADQRQWHILGMGIACPAGTSGDEVAQRLSGDLDGIIDLDPELRNRDGFPIMSARTTPLDCSHVESWLARQQATLDVAEQRAFALAQMAFEGAFEPLASHLRSRAQHLVVRYIAADDDPATASLMLRYLEHLASAHAAQTELLSFIHHTDFNALFAALETVPVAQLEPQLIISAGSNLSQLAIDRLEATGMLFTAQNQQGLIPGEAACALVLANIAPADEAQLLPLAQLSLPYRAEKPADAGRLDHRVLAQLFERVVATPDLAGSVEAVYCDASRPGARAAEAASAMTDVLTHLDPVAQRHSIDALCGSAEITAPLIALALAAHATANTGKPNLVAWLSASDERAAALVQPAVITIAEEAALAQVQSA